MENINAESLPPPSALLQARKRNRFSLFSGNEGKAFWNTVC